MSRTKNSGTGCPSGRNCGVCQDNRKYERVPAVDIDIEEQLEGALHPEELRLIHIAAGGVCDTCGPGCDLEPMWHEPCCWRGCCD